MARFIALDLRPYSVVENDGFRELLKELEPRYKILCRQNFSDKCIPELYITTKTDLKAKLSSAERVAITTDACTSCATNSHVTITVHYVTPDWELTSHVLQTRVFNESHTGKNIGVLLKEACLEWNIDDKDPALVTDNRQKHDFRWSGRRDDPSSFVLRTYIQSGCPEGLSCEQCGEGAWESEEGGWIFPSQYSGC